MTSVDREAAINTYTTNQDVNVFLDSEIYDEQFAIATYDDVQEQLGNLRDKYFIVKIGGKGNVTSDFGLNDPNSIDTVADDIIKQIESNNTMSKPVLILWDGDNYQSFSHATPSPFTEIIKKLFDKEKLNYKFAAFRDALQGWRFRDVASWTPSSVKFYKFKIPKSKVIITSWLANMYITWGSRYYPIALHKAIDGNPVTVIDEGNGNGHFLQYKKTKPISDDPDKSKLVNYPHMEIAVTSDNYQEIPFTEFKHKFIKETSNLESENLV